MATQIVQKTKEKEEIEPRARGGALARFREFPFFLSRMRDEFDRLRDRFSGQWPSLWDGDGWRWGLDVRDEDDAVVVQAEAPGFEAGDIDVQGKRQPACAARVEEGRNQGREGEDSGVPRTEVL